MPSTDTDALVLFGATGDLARKKIFPSIYRLEQRGVLGIPVIGVASSDLTDDDIRQRARESIEAKTTLDEAVWAGLHDHLCYVSGDYRDPALFEALADRLAECHAPMFYLAIPPQLFEDVVEGLAKVGL